MAFRKADKHSFTRQDVGARVRPDGFWSDMLADRTADGRLPGAMTAAELSPEQYERVMQMRKRLQRIIDEIDGVTSGMRDKAAANRSEYEAWHQSIEDSSFFAPTQSAPAFNMPTGFLRRK